MFRTVVSKSHLLIMQELLFLRSFIFFFQVIVNNAEGLSAIWVSLNAIMCLQYCCMNTFPVIVGPSTPSS